MKKSVLLLFAFLLVSIGIATAQTTAVHGVVTSSEDGLPIIGASVLVEGTTVGGITDVDGLFTLSNIPSSAKTLRISYIGMKPQSVAIKAGNITVVLQPDTEVLDEVVVTGYGSQRKASFTGAAAIVSKDDITKKTDPNFMKAMEGAVAGLQIDNSSSMPGTWSSVYIRGRGSLNSGTQPLYVIDGMPVNSDADGMSSKSNNMFDPMASVNAADIESVTVLKDAAATSIYGARAANGVIVITTKKGSQGKLDINLDVKQGFVTMANNNMEYANAKETMNLFAYGKAAANHTAYDTEYNQLIKDYKWDGESSYNWIDKVTRHGYYQDYNLSAQGRTGSTGFYLSLGYLNSKGLVINSDLERFTGRLNVDSKFGVFTLGANSSFSYSTNNGFSQSTSGSSTSPIVGATTSMLPMFPFYDGEGNYNWISKYNPLAIYDKEKGDIYQTTNQIINLNPYIRIDFGLGIYAKSTLGVNLTNMREYNYWSAIYNPQGMGYNGLGQQYNSTRSVVTWNNIIGWDYTFNTVHKVGLMIGEEIQKKKNIYDYYAGSDFPFADAGMRDLATAGTPQGSEYDWSKSNLGSYFFDAHYAYTDKYDVSASVRRDGSSVFGVDNRWGTFWSIGGKWRLSSESFLIDNQVITNASLRASYGTVGNQDLPDWYAARGFYSSGKNYNEIPGMTPSSVPNPKLTWEESQKFDIGFDLSFINRLNLTFDFYNEITKDALFKVPLSMTTGLTSAYQNLGSIRNRGVELGINATAIRNNSLTWNVYANLTWNQNRVLKLSTDKPIEGSYYIIEAGRPYTEFKMKEYAGIDPANGRPLWYLNETGNETTSDYSKATKRYMGSADPKVFGGFGTNLTWRGVDFSLAFNYRLGSKVYNVGAPFTGFGMRTSTPLKDVALNSWTIGNPDAKYPQWIFGDPYNATANSSRFLYNSSYLRISNAVLGYTLPARWTKKAMMQKVRAYVSADNIYTFTAKNFVGYSPDTYATGDIAWQYPAVVTFIGGVQITF
ncbi:MAG: TonB-dependent receptor [Mediterranea sp.]|jgi:TonB-linked SusC/RagA family outer membrane protein|nr:TonB-dependent receptor [Mediterranea sp.]